jgi:hypothetical protein
MKFIQVVTALFAWRVVLQVCPEFLNTVIFREPVPHAISIMAEVKYRYVRQMATKHNINNWQPSAWNLTWWEALGPALVGNYATRTLLGRESLCRSAGNMGKPQLDDALGSLLSFDMVMTLGRSQDIDLGITTLLGWPARNFSSQPGARVREVSVDLATKGELAVGDSKASKGAVAASRHLLQVGDASSSSGGSSPGGADSSSGEESISGPGRSLLAVPQHNKHMHSGQPGQHAAAGTAQPVKHAAPLMKKGKGQLLQQSQQKHSQQQQKQKQQQKPQQHKPAGVHAAANRPAKGVAEHPQPQENMHVAAKSAARSDIQHSVVVPAVAFAHAAAHGKAISSSSSSSTSSHPAPVAAAESAATMSAKQLEQQAAVMLVSTTWHERQAELLNVYEKAAVWVVTGEPRIEHTGQQSKHGAHLVRVHFKSTKGQQTTEVWHSFPRHTFAFLAADVAKLEQLTALDMQVYLTADMMFNLDTVWLQAMLNSSHYRKKLRSVVATQTSCGFAGMIPVDPNLMKESQIDDV